MVGQNISKATTKVACVANDEQAEDSHVASRGELSQVDIIKKQADQITELAMANRDMIERCVMMEQRLNQAKPGFGHQKEALSLQRPTTYKNRSKRPIEEPPSLRTSVFERMGRPTKATSYSTDRAFSVAISLNNLRPLTPYRRPANQRPQRGGFHQARRENRRRNSWAGPEGERRWHEADLALRWRKDEWIKPPSQPLKDRHLEVEELAYLSRNSRPEPRIGHRPTDPRLIVLILGRGLRKEARERLSASLLIERVLAIIFPDSWRASKMLKFEGNTDPIIHLSSTVVTGSFPSKWTSYSASRWNQPKP